MEYRKVALALAAALILTGLVACSKEEKTTETVTAPAATEAPAAPAAAPAPAPAAAGPSADVTLQSHDPNLSGTVHFTQEAGGVHVVADVKGVKPGQHGFHLHEKGDCSTPDYKSAGGHFNPANSPHACDPTNPRHAGDFGNITVGADGTGHLDITTTGLSFDGPNSLIGKAVILHSGVDDCKTQPTGNSGDRLACGVVSGSGAPAAASPAAGTEPMGTDHH
ncbi:MAG TPA: superoxide dismutase family protein [Thermoanaerobaculia bacterium]|nr:superoxide dismutase family protein [Thermoanaerobaculia bacterium]